MFLNNENEDPIKKLLEKDLCDCVEKYEKTHGVIVPHVLFEYAKATNEGNPGKMNFDARVDVIV